MGIFKKIGSSAKSIFGRPRPASAPTAPKVGTTQPPLDPEASWGEFEKEVKRQVNRAWDEARPKLVDGAEWYPLISTNVDRIRYGEDDRKLQVIFKNGSCYEYSNVEPNIFMDFLRAPSPGQFVWYVLRQYQYPYQKISGGHATSAPAADRFGGQPFAVPEDIQATEAAAGRQPAQGIDHFNRGTPTSQGVVPPPPAFRKGQP